MHSIFNNLFFKFKLVIIINKLQLACPANLLHRTKRILAGYFKTGSHEIVNIKYCPIQPSYCDEIIDYIRVTAKEFSVSGYEEKKHAGDLKHVVIRASNYNNRALVILVINSVKMLENKSIHSSEVNIYTQNYSTSVANAARY